MSFFTQEIEDCIFLTFDFCNCAVYSSVKIVRLISKNTVEEGMLRVAQAKLRLEQDVTATTG